MTAEEELILQRKLAKFLVSDVFHTIREEDILQQTREGCMHRGKHLTEGQVKALKKEAEAFAKSNFYEILMSELRYHARRKEQEADTEAKLVSARMLSYFCDMIKSKIAKIVDL